MIFGRFAFREMITYARAGIVALALFGVLLITNPFSFLNLSKSVSSIGSVSGSQIPLAEVLAFIGGIFLSLWVILGKKGRVEQLKEPISLTFAVRTFTIIPIGIVSSLAYALRTRLFLAQTQDFGFVVIYLVLFAIFAGAVPDYLFYRGVEKLPVVQRGCFS